MKGYVVRGLLVFIIAFRVGTISRKIGHGGRIGERNRREYQLSEHSSRTSFYDPLSYLNARGQRRLHNRGMGRKPKERVSGRYHENFLFENNRGAGLRLDDFGLDDTVWLTNSRKTARWKVERPKIEQIIFDGDYFNRNALRRALGEAKEYFQNRIPHCTLAQYKHEKAHIMREEQDLNGDQMKDSPLIDQMLNRLKRRSRSAYHNPRKHRTSYETFRKNPWYDPELVCTTDASGRNCATLPPCYNDPTSNFPCQIKHLKSVGLKDNIRRYIEVTPTSPTCLEGLEEVNQSKIEAQVLEWYLSDMMNYYFRAKRMFKNAFKRNVSLPSEPPFIFHLLRGLATTQQRELGLIAHNN